MGNVFIHLTMSLDGFIAKPDDDLSWMFQHGSDEMAGQIMKEVGAVIVGNRGFQDNVRQYHRARFLADRLYRVVHE